MPWLLRLDSADRCMEDIERHLVETGKHAELSSLLRERLQEKGWYDDVFAVASRKLSVAKDPGVKSPEVQEVHKKAMEMVPESVKIEMLQLILSLVDDLVEKA